MKFTQEHEEIRRTMKKFIDEEINPHVDEWEAAEQFPAHEVFKKLGAARHARAHQAGGLRRRGARLQLLDGVGRDARARSAAAACRWRSACRPTWRRRRWRASARTSCARNSSRPPSPATTCPASASRSPAPAPTWPRSRPRRGRTAATTSSTAPRCGSPTACRPTGCACSPTPPKARRTRTRRLIIVPMKTKGVSEAKKIRKIGMMSSRHRA